MSGMSRSPLELDHLVVARAAQPRGDGARLELYDDAGPAGSFVEEAPAELEGASKLTLLDGDGGEVLVVLHPGRLARARVDVAGEPVGFVSRVGRVRANVELHGPGRRPEGEPLAVLKPLDDGDGWHGVGATLRWWLLSAPSSDAYGEARYTLDLAPTVDPELRRLLVAATALVDRAVLQR